MHSDAEPMTARLQSPARVGAIIFFTGISCVDEAEQRGHAGPNAPVW